MTEESEEQNQDDRKYSEDEVDYPPNNFIYRIVDVLFLLAGICTYVVDWSFDVLTACNHWWHNDSVWFYLTVLFICLPSLVMMSVSLYWYIKDASNQDVPQASKLRWMIRVLLLICQLGPILRYLDSLYYGIISRKHWKAGNRELQKVYYTWMLYEDADCVLLRLFESFMEAAPQLVLQLYILALFRNSEYSSNWVYVLCIGCFTSLLSLAWGVTAYSRTSRFTNLDKNNISLKGTVVLFFWHIFSIGSRVIAMVLFASKFRLWLLVVCFGHWMLMVIWLLILKSLRHVCCSKVEEVSLRYTVLSKLGEIALSFVLAAVYLFSFINVQEESTRNKYASYYIICGFENIIMVTLFLIYGDGSQWYYIPGPVIHFLCFVVGLVLMTVYYGYFHPTLKYNSLCNGQVPVASGTEMKIASFEPASKMKTELICNSNSCDKTRT